MSDQETNMSKKTKRGVLVLVCICLLIIYTPRFLSWANPPDNLELTFSEITKVEQLTSNKARAEFQRKNKFVKKSKFQRPPKKFDPNEYSKEDWMKLGLSEKQVKVIFSFTKNRLRSNDDLKKIFVISEPLYQLIKDSTYYPVFEKDTEKKQFLTPTVEKKEIKALELNTADMSELQTIPGIGEFFAKMIIKKRTELGGFVSKQQLLEVYKMEIDKFNEIEKYFKVNPEIVSKLNINEATIEELRKHPYIDYKVANSIFKMRQQKGSYKSIEELNESVLINVELFQKLKPYVYL